MRNGKNGKTTFAHEVRSHIANNVMTNALDRMSLNWRGLSFDVTISEVGHLNRSGARQIFGQAIRDRTGPC